MESSLHKVAIAIVEVKSDADDAMGSAVKVEVVAS